MSPAILPLEPVAVLTHDYACRSPLNSWPPVPSDVLHQGELLALKAFGSLLQDIRSPRHMYMAAWRDPDCHSKLPGEEDKPPTGVLFHAQFGVAPYETTPSLLEMAEMFNQLDRAGLRLDLVRDGEGKGGPLRLDALELELNGTSAPKGRRFRSCWQGEEIKGLDLSLQFDAPATRRDPFRFHIRGRLPRRYNRRDEIEPEFVEFAASGGAMPLPSWVNY